MAARGAGAAAAMPVIGFLGLLARCVAAADAFNKAWPKPALSKAGTSRSSTAEAEGQFARLPELAADWCTVRSP